MQCFIARKASYELVCTQVNDAWRRVATDEVILKGFRQCSAAMQPLQGRYRRCTSFGTTRDHWIKTSATLDCAGIQTSYQGNNAGEVKKDIGDVDEDGESDDSKGGEIDDDVDQTINDVDDEDDIEIVMD